MPRCIQLDFLDVFSNYSIHMRFDIWKDEKLSMNETGGIWWLFSHEKYCSWLKTAVQGLVTDGNKVAW